MSVGEGFGRTIGIGVLIAGAIGAVWLFRDRIAGWFTSAVTAPVTGAVSGAVAAVSDVANTPILQIPSGDVTVGDVVSGVNPLTMIATLPGQILGAVVGGLGTLTGGESNQESYEPVIAPTAPSTIPTEADILWQAAVAEVSPPPTSPPPGAWEQRGTSLLGAPLYRPAFGKVGELHYTKDGEFYSGDIWIAGGTNPEYYIVPTGHSLSSGGFELGTFEAMADRYYGISDYEIVWM